MKVDEIFDIDVEDIVALDSEDWSLDVIIFHVYSGGVCASHVFNVGLVFYMNAWFDVVTCRESNA